MRTDMMMALQMKAESFRVVYCEKDAGIISLFYHPDRGVCYLNFNKPNHTYSSVFYAESS